MKHFFSALCICAASSPVLAEDISSTAVWGMSFKSGYSTGDVSIIEINDTYVMTFKGGIGRPCEAVLHQQEDGSYAPVITNENVRACEPTARVIFQPQDGDTLPIEITIRDKKKIYPLRLRNIQQRPATIPNGLDIQGASLGKSMSEAQSIFSNLAEMTEKVAIVGRNPRSLSYSYRQNDASNVYMAISESSASEDSSAFNQAELAETSVTALARFWTPASEARPNLDTMRRALFDKFGTPSLQTEKERFSIYEWQYDLDAKLLTSEAALVCSVSNQSASMVSYSSNVSTGFADRIRKPYKITLRGALSCGVTLRVRLDLVEGYTVARMEQTLWRHDSFLRDQLFIIANKSSHIIARTDESSEQENSAPDL